jgi:hypothetical protein
MPNLDPWINQTEDMTTKTINNFENHLLSIRTERQKMIRPTSHPTYERHQKNIEMIDWALEIIFFSSFTAIFSFIFISSFPADMYIFTLLKYINLCNDV